MINTTIVHIDGQDDIHMPGMDLTLEQAAVSLDAAFKTQSMEKRSTEVDGVRHLYFNRRTGTKG